MNEKYLKERIEEYISDMKIFHKNKNYTNKAQQEYDSGVVDGMVMLKILIENIIKGGK